MAKKYYAVKAGRNPGVYTSWTDCEKQVKGFGGAIYKSFSTEDEAYAFIGERRMSLADFLAQDGTATTPISTTKGLVAYIDGSFDKRAGTVGAGGVLIYEGQENTFAFGTKDPQYTAFWNVSGELLAAMHVMQYAKDHNMGEVHLYYDYMGIEMWATGRWKRNNTLTQSYYAFVQTIVPTVKVHFHKVVAHTGVHYNEMADQLAKKGTTLA